MKKRIAYTKKIALLAAFILGTNCLKSQTVENEFQSRTEVTLSYKPIDKIKLSLTPELRLDENFNPDKFIVEAGLSYKPVRILSLGANYRYIANMRDEKSTEYLSRYAFDATLGKTIQRWKPSLRIRYTNYTEDNSNSNYMRYKAKVEYNIKKCKLSPLVAAEAFNDLNDGGFYKMRYTIGTDYKLNKNSAISVAYKYDYYLQEYLNKHILYVGYKYKF